MSTNMIECPICNFHYHENRNHCPTCGTVTIFSPLPVTTISMNGYHTIVVAHGAERARQLPQSPRFFQLVD